MGVVDWFYCFLDSLLLFDFVNNLRNRDADPLSSSLPVELNSNAIQTPLYLCRLYCPETRFAETRTHQTGTSFITHGWALARLFRKRVPGAGDWAGGCSGPWRALSNTSVGNRRPLLFFLDMLAKIRLNYSEIKEVEGKG